MTYADFLRKCLEILQAQAPEDAALCDATYDARKFGIAEGFPESRMRSYGNEADTAIYDAAEASGRNPYRGRYYWPQHAEGKAARIAVLEQLINDAES